MIDDSNSIKCVQCGLPCQKTETACPQCKATLGFDQSKMERDSDENIIVAVDATGTTTTIANNDEDQQFVDADIVPDSEVQLAEPVVNQGSPFKQPLVAKEEPVVKPVMVVPVWMPGYEDFAARGGAVASLVLGISSVLGALLTPLACINALVGLALAAWGFSSKKRRVAMFGIGFCCLGIMICFVHAGYKVADATGVVKEAETTEADPFEPVRNW